MRTGMVNERIAPFEAEECEMPHASRTDGGTMPSTPSSR